MYASNNLILITSHAHADHSTFIAYVCALTRYAFSSEPLGVMEAHPIKYFPSASDDSDAGKVDMSTSATLLFPNNVKAHLSAGFYKGSSFGKLWDIIGFIYYGFGDLLQCELENGSIEFKGCVAPHLGHSLIITRKDGEKRVEKVYAYKDAPEIQKNWSTYVCLFVIRSFFFSEDTL